MRVTHLSEALSQVRSLRESMIDKQQFRGFSGPVRAISGCAALVAAFVMARPGFPPSNTAHIIGWGILFLFASLLNLGAVFYWFWNDHHVARNVRRLRPTLDVLPPLLVGAALTFTLMLHRQPDHLFGIWMCMFGLTNLATRYVLPAMIPIVGIFYVICGIACLLLPQIAFTDPWPMGLVFFVGETASGIILYLDRRRYQAVTRLIESWEKEDEHPHDQEPV